MSQYVFYIAITMWFQIELFYDLEYDKQLIRRSAPVNCQVQSFMDLKHKTTYVQRL
jgi:hypothetical protein